jgi:hypothetical protein
MAAWHLNNYTSIKGCKIKYNMKKNKNPSGVAQLALLIAR